jgi:hypothetical protein
MSCLVHEDSAHQVGGNPEEVRPVLPLDRVLIDKLDVGLVHERGGLQRVVGALAREISSRQGPQFCVDQRNEAVECLLAAIAPFLQQAGDIVRHRRNAPAPSVGRI